MLKVLVYVVLIALGIAVSLMERWVPALPPLSGMHEWEAQILVGALGGGVLALLLTNLVSLVNRQLAQEGGARRLIQGVLASVVGAVCGLVVAWAFELLLAHSPLLRALQGALVLSLIVVGFVTGYRHEKLWEELVGSRSTPPGPGSGPKLIDTSAIIDGRIGDLVKTGFIEGKIVIADFVLSELQAIADSSDNLRRRKGRRGLDILAELRRSNNVHIETLSKDYPGVADVDRKLIQLAKELNAKIITTDYNLNKVAKVEGVPVLNINELANAIKPRFLPGEEIEVEVIDKGEEINQGIGYLDDGTMVVVENGRRFIGKKIRTIVNSSLQTEAGKMLFVRPKLEPPKWEQQ